MKSHLMYPVSVQSILSIFIFWQVLLIISPFKYKLWLSISISLYEESLSRVHSSNEPGSDRDSLIVSVWKLLALGVLDLGVNLSSDK